MNTILNAKNSPILTPRRLLFVLAATLLASLTYLTGCNGTGTTAEATGQGGKGGGGGRGKGKNAGGGGPVPVVVAKVTTKNVPIELQVVGNVEAFSTVSIRPRVSGQLTKVGIQDGDYVKKGAPLFAIDPSVIEGQLAQAQANLSRSMALLSQAEANLARDQAQEQFQRGVAERYAKLVAEGVMSKDQGEQQKTSADVAAQALAADRASIASAKAQIEADKAAVANIQLQLSYAQEKAPIDGRVGSVTIKPGNIVTANTTEVMQILQVEPIYVTFAVPEGKLADVKRYMAAGNLPVTAKPQDGSAGGETGRLAFIDNAVDTSTGTIKLKGLFTNAGHTLWPGQFVNVTLRLTTRQNAITVPNQAVQTGQDGTFVYVVKEDRSVEVRPVVTGPRVDLDLVVEKGLSVDETVVTEGQLRLQPGSRVQLRGEGRQGGEGRGGEGRGGEGRGSEQKAAPGDGKQTGESGEGKRGGFKAKGEVTGEGFKGKGKNRS